MGTIIRRNERSWAIELITEINLMLQNLKLYIKRAGGESTLSVNKKSMFPDVLLYADEDQSRILQGWELKMPDVLITNEELIRDAKRKAEALGLNSFFLWNFTYGRLYVKTNSGSFAEARTWTGTDHIRTREDVKTYKAQWVPVIRDIILEINQYFEKGRLAPAPITTVLTDNLMTALIKRNKELTAANYRAAAAGSMKTECTLKAWWDSFREEYVQDELDLYQAYAKTVLLNWMNRFVFANLIRKYHSCANLISRIDDSVSPEQGNEIIEEIIRQGDFYNVFHKLDLNEKIPEEAWADLTAFNQFLNENQIEKIDQSVLQNILEGTVNLTKREIRGQYTTPVWLADFLCQITVDNWKGDCGDLCAGTGTIANAIIQNKRKRLCQTADAYKTTWISDKSAYPLQISNIALTAVDAVNIPIQMFQMDVFEVEVGKEIQLHNPADGSRFGKEFPGLDAVISNLPFVKYNNISSDETGYFVEYVGKIKERTGIALKQGKTDLYMLLPFKIHELLKKEGRLGIILSNSWLGTDTGKDFFHALTYYYKIEMVVLSSDKRWFENAKVVATLLILQKREIGPPNQEEEKKIEPPGTQDEIYFSLIKKNIKALPEEETTRLISSIVLKKELDTSLLDLKQYTLEEIDKIQSKGVSLNALFHDVSWISRMEDCLIPVGSIFTVKRGERRGCNELFYPCEKHGIEEAYIKPVLKNPAKLRSYCAETDLEAFCCRRSKEELRTLGHTGALAWIEKFEHITNALGKALPEALSRSGYYWYEMDDGAKADFVTALNPNKRLFVARFSEKTFVDQRFTRLINKKEENVPLLHALLNSMYGMFAIEAVGFGRGLGVLDASSSNFKKIHMINPAMISSQDAAEIIALFEPIKDRDVWDTEEELKDKTRELFDRRVLRAVGKEHLYENIKHSLLSMQRTRLNVR